MAAIATSAEAARVEAFKKTTQAKLDGLRCPRHHQPPRLAFHGRSLHDLTISMSACCEHLIQIANRAIASPAESPLR